VRGQVNGVDHPTWEDGTPLLVGQSVTYLVPDDLQQYPGDTLWWAVIHEVSADEVRIGGLTNDDEDWEEQVSPDDLESGHTAPDSGSRGGAS
jgi:hypothetical protein